MKSFLSLLALLLVAANAAGANERQTPSVRAIEKVLPAVVNIATETVVEVRDPFTDMLRQFWGDHYGPNPRQTTTSLGSGVIIDEEGYLLTNEHVVRRATKIWVKVGEEEYPATRIAGDATSDVALLQIKAPEGRRFTAVAFAPDDDLMLGETVIALGNPFGLGGSVSRGILSSKSRRQPLEDQPLEIRDWLQTDAAINPGNSGGPLINLNGELIGLNVAVFREGQGIGFAIPIRRVSESISRFLSPEETSSLWFGARIRPGRKALEITQVEPSSPAAIAGLQAGDEILQLNQHSPTSFIDFTRRLLNLGSTDPVKLTVNRAGKRREVNVRLRPEKEFFDNELLSRHIGLKVTPNTPDLSRRLGLPPYRGFVITDVRDGSPAAKAGLLPEHVIRAVDETVPRDLIEFAKLIHRKSKGDKAVFDLVFTETRGRYYMFREGRTSVGVE
jgi:serine protease Do